MPASNKVQGIPASDVAMRHAVMNNTTMHAYIHQHTQGSIPCDAASRVGVYLASFKMYGSKGPQKILLQVEHTLLMGRP